MLFKILRNICFVALWNKNCILQLIWPLLSTNTLPFTVTGIYPWPWINVSKYNNCCKGWRITVSSTVNRSVNAEVHIPTTRADDVTKRRVWWTANSTSLLTLIYFCWHSKYSNTCVNTANYYEWKSIINIVTEWNWVIYIFGYSWLKW